MCRGLGEDDALLVSERKRERSASWGEEEEEEEGKQEEMPGDYYAGNRNITPVCVHCLP